MTYIKFDKPQNNSLILIAVVILMLILSLILISRSLLPEKRRTNSQHWGCNESIDVVCSSQPKMKNNTILSLVESQKLEEISSQHMLFDKYFFRSFGLINRAKNGFKIWPLLLKYRVLTTHAFLEGIQAKITDHLEKYLWEDNLALIQGFVFGNDDDISQDVKEKFRLFGLYHVLAASGSNLSLWILPISLIIPIYSRKKLFFSTCFWAMVYFLLLGDNPPVARATTMLILGQLGSKLLFKQVNRKRLLLISALILLTFSSSYLTSLSFWMSILATWAMIIFMSDDSVWLQFLLGEGVSRKKWSFTKIFLELYQASWAAQLALAPIFIWFFEEFSWAGLVVGPLFLPLVEVAIQLSFSLVFLSGLTIIWPAVEFFLVFISSFYTDLSVFILKYINRVPIAQGVWKTTSRGSQFLFLGSWGLILMMSLLITRRKPNRKAIFFYE